MAGLVFSGLARGVERKNFRIILGKALHMATYSGVAARTPPPLPRNFVSLRLVGGICFRHTCSRRMHRLYFPIAMKDHTITEQGLRNRVFRWIWELASSK